MKTAFLIPGVLRDFESSLEKTKEHILSNLDDTDIFIHVWKNFDDLKFVEERKTRKNVSGVLEVNEYIRQLSISEIKKIINKYVTPTKLIFQNQNDIKGLNNERFDEYIKDTKKRGIPVSANLLPHLYKIYRCNQLRKSYEKKYDFKYDVVFRSRTELNFKNKFPIEILENLDDKSIYIPNWRGKVSDELGRVNDTFAVGTSEVMNIYCNLYIKLEEYLKEGIAYNTHILLGKHLERNNIEIKDFKFPYKLRNLIFGEV